MRWSQTLIPTLRQPPGDAVAPSHALMLRAGMIHQTAAGAYSYLPLGWRVLRKAMTIIREEMDHAGAVEVFLPSLQPLEWWEQTGRREAYGDNLFVITDRHGRKQALGPTHEEVITKLIDAHVHSYRQLPLTVYQIQTKFRDEFRPRFGVLRSREFQMKDAYSFDLDAEGLEASYRKMYDAYERIFQRCGLPYVTVEAESGPIGGSASHEFMVPSPTGEDIILASDKSNYAANVEKCAIGEREWTLDGEPTGDLEEIHTPNCPGIDSVCDFFKRELKTKLKPRNMLKTLVCRVGERWLLAVVRGDHDLNESKLRDAVGGDIELADETEAKAAGFDIGFVGPQITAGRDDTDLIIDPDAANGGFWVTGANKADHHVKHFNWQRDLIEPLAGASASADRITVADIRNAVDGDPSPKNDDGVLRESRGIEIGHVFKLGCKYSTALNATVLDENQNEVEPIMGCYGIGVNRLLAAAIERTPGPDGSPGGHDDGGIIWPMQIAPYHVVITPIRYESRAKDVADGLYAQLTDAGVEVLLDDRDERPGVKFKDADLIGIPLRITIGDKGLTNDQVEFKLRHAAEPEMVAVEQIVERIRAAVA